MPYVVRVADMFHYMDQDEEYDLEPFATLDEAEEAARRLIDRDLDNLARSAMSAEELVALWYGFGADPYILSSEAGERMTFRAADYVRERACVVAKG